MRRDDVRKWLGMPSQKYVDSLMKKQREAGGTSLDIKPVNKFKEMFVFVSVVVVVIFEFL